MYQLCTVSRAIILWLLTVLIFLLLMKVGVGLKGGGGLNS